MTVTIPISTGTFIALIVGSMFLVGGTYELTQYLKYHDFQPYLYTCVFFYSAMIVIVIAILNVEHNWIRLSDECNLQNCNSVKEKKD